MSQPQGYQRVVAAILETHPQAADLVYLYHQSPSFKAGVDVFAQSVIPTFLVGLAAQAKSEDQAREAFRILIERGLTVTDTVPHDYVEDPENPGVCSVCGRSRTKSPHFIYPDWSQE